MPGTSLPCHLGFPTCGQTLALQGLLKQRATSGEQFILAWRIERAQGRKNGQDNVRPTRASEAKSESCRKFHAKFPCQLADCLVLQV